MRLLTWVVLLLASGAMARPEPSFVLEFEDGYVATGPQGPLAPRAEGHPELAPGRFGQALKSGPATGYLHFPTAGVINRLAGTVEMWVSPIDWDGTERKFHAFFDCRGEGALYLYKYFEGGLLMLSANNPAGPYQSASAAIGGWKPGDWHHIAGTWSASQQHVYVDGKRIGSTSPLLPMALAETFALGDHPWHIDRSSSSLIDRVRIYDRLLSDAHIAAHYAGNYDHSVPVGASSVTLTAPIEPATRTLTAVVETAADETAGVLVEASVVGDGKVLATAPPESLATGRAAVSLPLAQLQPGRYAVQARVVREGRELAVLTRPFGIPDLSWRGNQIGRELKVLPPWTPLVARADAGAVEIGCLGRVYRHDGTGLPARIDSAGASLLARPVTLQVRAGGQLQPLRAEQATLALSSETQAVVKGVSHLGPLTVAATTTTEYDGLMVIDLDLRLEPGAALESVSLDIPVRPEVALYRHRWAASWEGVSGLVPLGEGVVDESSFLPYAWLGDNDRGLFWFCESGRDWPNYDQPSAFQTVREADAVTLRLNLLAGQAAPGAWRYRFGLQATPVKPLPADWRRWRMAQAPGATFSILWPTPQPDSMTYFGYPEASNPEVFGQRIAKLHEQGVKAVPYSCLSFFSEAAPEWPFFATSWQTGSADTSASDVAAYNAAFARINPLSPTYSDFIVAKNMEFMKRYDLDGFYHDNVHPYPIGTNVEGGGWVDAKGVGHAVYPILAYRDLHRRLYAAVKTERPDAHLMAHMSGKVTIPFLAYEDSYLDGEHFRDRVKDSYLDLLPLDTFRAEFMGRQWGLMPYFLPEFRGEYARQVAPTRGLMGLLLIHDVQPWNLWCNAEVVNAMFRALDAFGYVESRFVPYFDPRPPARTALPNVQVSAYLRDGRALLVVANLDREPKQGVVTIDAGRLGLPLGEVVTWPECQPVQRQGSDLTVSLEGLDYRLLLLGPAP